MRRSVRNAGLLVLSLGFVRCNSNIDTSSVAEASQRYADEAARADLACSDAEAVGEAQEHWSHLTATCLLVVAVAVHMGCSRGLLNAYCPTGTQKVIHDTWDYAKTATVDCDLLHDVICGGAAFKAGELMREACGAVP
jgi:hypothetical protein